jgi:hypothetical protein
MLEYSAAEIAAVARFYGVDPSVLDDGQRIAMMDTAHAAWMVLGLRARKLGIELGDAPWIKRARDRVERWLADPR